MGGLQILTYVSFLFFVIVIVAKMIKISNMPIHIRWDLYPIPHEKGKSKYGGSYFEEVDWWTKPKNFSLVNELAAMAKEIIFIHGVYKNNRPLWVFSFPFHLGMYCLVGFAGLLVLGAMFNIWDIAIAADSTDAIGKAVYYLTLGLGTAGWILSALGAIGLIFSRMFARELKAATVFSDYVNLLFLLAVFVTGFASWMTADPSYSIIRGFIYSIITINPVGVLPQAVATQIWVMIALMFYFPFTHMTHMIGKYFTYHKVRWEDEANLRGSKIESDVNEALGFKLNWAAPHIKTGGTWAEAATTIEEEDKNEK